jgi:L-amino acid N-acyltransferase YncA
MDPVPVRPALEADMPAIAEIYAHHVLHGAATFEIVPPDAVEMTRRWREVEARGLPWLVAGAAGAAVTGYAYATPYRSREAYRFTVENSVYIDPGHLGEGIGTALLAALIEKCEAGSWRQMVAVIGDRNNSASVRLHEKLGFAHIGVLQAVGFKFGRWVDTVLMQRSLGRGNMTPPEE